MSKTYSVPCSNCKGTGKVDITGLQGLRLQQGLKQEEVADSIGITRSQYANIEGGRSGISTNKVRPLARMLKVSTDELLDILTGAES